MRVLEPCPCGKDMGIMSRFVGEERHFQPVCSDYNCPLTKTYQDEESAEAAWNGFMKAYRNRSPSLIQKAINKVRTLFHKGQNRDDPFVWKLAEALLWRDEEVSGAAIPSPIKEQPEAKRYYDDALYLIQFTTGKHDFL